MLQSRLASVLLFQSRHLCHLVLHCFTAALLTSTVTCAQRGALASSNGHRHLTLVIYIETVDENAPVSSCHTMRPRLVLYAAVAFFFLPISKTYKAKKPNSQLMLTKEPLVNTKVIEFEHTEPKITPIEPMHLSPPPKYSEVVIEETHELAPESHIELSPEQVYVPYLPQSAYGSKPYNRQVQTSRPNTHFLLHMVPPGVRRKHESGIPDLLALLAPLAAIPLLGSLAVSSFTTMLTLTGLGRRRRRRDLSEQHEQVLSQLTNRSAISNSSLPPIFPLHLHSPDENTEPMSHFNSSSTFNPFEKHLNASDPNASFSKEMPIFGEMNDADKKVTNPISELFQLDVVQQYLRQSGRPDHNDQIIASYLACRGMFSSGNHCLERLACHYADIENGRLKPLERDVAALIIYSLLRNSHIDSNFKRRLQRAALFGYDTSTSKSSPPGSSPFEASFVPVCDREFPCPKSEMP